MPTADVSVRPAIPGDEDALTEIQLKCWEATLGADAVAALPADQVRASWAASIVAPPSRKHRVFSACDGPTVVGFAAVTPEGEILALEVAPEHRRLGHGSRLLAASVDHLRSVESDQVRAWAVRGDDAREAFLRGAGFGEGGVERTLEGPGGDVTERLWRGEL